MQIKALDICKMHVMEWTPRWFHRGSWALWYQCHSMPLGCHYLQWRLQGHNQFRLQHWPLLWLLQALNIEEWYANIHFSCFSSSGWFCWLWYVGYFLPFVVWQWFCKSLSSINRASWLVCHFFISACMSLTHLENHARQLQFHVD